MRLPVQSLYSREVGTVIRETYGVVGIVDRTTR